MIEIELAEMLAPWQPAERDDWHFDQVKNHYDIVLGKMLQNTPHSADDIEVPYLKAQHIQWDSVEVNELPTMWASPKEIETLRIKKGDLLVCEGGEVGRAAIVSNEPPTNCIIQNALHLVRPKATGNKRFLRYLLFHATSHDWLEVICNRATIAHFTSEKFKELWIWIPSVSEQRIIADYLDRETERIDALVKAKERLRVLLGEKRRALITQAVTHGLNPAAPTRDSGVEWLGHIPAHWQVVNLKRVGQIGNGSTPLRDNEDYWKGGLYPWLTSTVVNNDIIGEPTDFVTPTALQECHLPIVQPNSVLIAITGQGKTRGMAAILPYEATINQHMAYISPIQDRLTPQFLQLYLTGVYDILRIISEGMGSTKGALTIQQIAEFPLPLPPVAEQEEIVAKVKAVITKLDSLAQATQKTIDLLQERRTALIAAAVTGKILIPESSWN